MNLANFDRTLELEPQLIVAYYYRGSLRLRMDNSPQAKQHQHSVALQDFQRICRPIQMVDERSTTAICQPLANGYYFGNIRDYLNPKGFMVGRAKRAPP